MSVEDRSARNRDTDERMSPEELRRAKQAASRAFLARNPNAQPVHARTSNDGLSTHARLEDGR